MSAAAAIDRSYLDDLSFDASLLPMTVSDLPRSRTLRSGTVPAYRPMPLAHNRRRRTARAAQSMFHRLGIPRARLARLRT